MHLKKTLLSISILALFANTAFALSLSEVQTLSSNNNYQIKQYESLYESSKELKQSAFKSFLPNLSTSYSYTRLDEPPYQIVNGNKMVMGSNNNYQWNVTITQPIFTGFYLLNKYRYAKYDEAFSKANLEVIRNQVITNAKIAYFNVLYNQKMLETRQLAVAQYESHLKDAQSFYKQGLIPKVDLLKSEVAYSNAKQELKQAYSNLTDAIAQLNQLLNEPIDKTHTFEQVADVVDLKTPLDSLYAQIDNRPDIKALSYAIQKANAQVGMVKSGYYPQLQLRANYNRNGQNLDMSNNPYSDNSIYSLNIIANWDIFDWGKTKNDVQAAKLQEIALQNELNNLKTQSKTQILNAYDQAQVAYHNISVAQTALAQANENYKLTNERYLNQLATSTDILDARALLTQAEANYYGAIYGYCIALEKLANAVGKTDEFDYLIRFR
ncbi:TolC family protein [Desulfurella sp.]|uniref:TolC family protein n=1 Tax=Desulfurella sp. TaxID=1962857 RepID=UPI0025C01A18|nr:TolC family protein [Desulfurella sp.]